MNTIIVTGSYGLIGSEVCRFYDNIGFNVIGIDNDMRKYFFGESSKQKNKNYELKNYTHYDIDIRDLKGIEGIFSKYSSDICLVVHTAAQPSHDWAAKEPMTDFSINATGTLNLLECFHVIINILIIVYIVDIISINITSIAIKTFLLEFYLFITIFISKILNMLKYIWFR